MCPLRACFPPTVSDCGGPVRTVPGLGQDGSERLLWPWWEELPLRDSSRALLRDGAEEGPLVFAGDMQHVLSTSHSVRAQWAVVHRCPIPAPL